MEQAVNYVYFDSFNVGRWVIQKDIISPVLFILALDALVQQYDTVPGKGFKCERILRLDVLGYADDVTLIFRHSERHDKKTNKNCRQWKKWCGHEHEFIKNLNNKQKYKYKCDFCPRGFKTERNMQIHRCNYIYNYDTTQEVYEVEKVVDMFGHACWQPLTTQYSWNDKDIKSRNGSDSMYWNSTTATRYCEMWELWSQSGLAQSMWALHSWRRRQTPLHCWM